MPPKALLKLPYGDRILRTLTTINTFDDYVFRLNGIYDPDYSGAGH